MATHDDTGDGSDSVGSQNDAHGPITLQKQLEERKDGFVITYTVESSADGPVVISYTDEIGVEDPDKIGFHPDYGPTSWDIESGHLAVDHEIDPMGETRLVLGIVTEAETIPPSDGLNEPEISKIEPAAEASIPDSSGDVSNGHDESGLFERAKSSLLSTGEASMDESDLSYEDQPAPSRPDDVSIGADDDDGPAEMELADPTNTTPKEAGSSEADSAENGSDIVAELAEALENDEANIDDLETVKAYLESDVSRSEQIRLEHVQSRIDDLAAYVRMLEDFIDTYGTLEEFAEETYETVSSVESHLDELTDAVDEIDAECQAHKDDLESLAGRVDAHETELQSVSGSHDTLASSVDELEMRLESEMTEIYPSVERFKQMTDALNEIFSPDVGADAEEQ